MAKDENALSRDERRFAEQVRVLREERGWTQADLAERLRGNPHELDYMTQATISRIEQGARPVRMMEALALSRLFGRTQSAMIHPDGKEIWLPLIGNAHSSARKTYATLKENAREMARAQIQAEKDLGTLDQMFGDGSELHEDSKQILEGLRRNLQQFVRIDPIEEVTAIVYGVMERVERQEEA